MPVAVQGCLYPTNAELQALQQELLPRFSTDRLGFDLLPFKSSDLSQIIYHQPDIFRGMQPFRGLDKPTRIANQSTNWIGKYCAVEPGYWGEHDQISEEWLTRASRIMYCGNEAVDLTEEIGRRMERLLERRYNRIEFNIWQALAFGHYEALNSDGQIIHQAYFNIPQISVAVPWSNITDSTPLADFRCIQLRSRGTSASFGADAVAYMNRVTANCLFKNQNPNDVGKAGLSACCTFMGPDMVNQQFAAQGLPQIQVYDQGWVDDSDNFYPYIPDGRVIVMGKRPGNVPLGHYWYTRNVLGCTPSSGPATFINDNCNTGNNPVPRNIKLYDVHNGGPAVEYPRAIVILETGCENDC